MRGIVRLLPWLAILGITAAALVVLAGWAQDARADPTVPDPVGTDAPPAPPAPATPPVPQPPPPSAPAPPAVPSAPQTPPVTMLPPPPPTAPDLSPGTTPPTPPGLPADTPTAPAPAPPPDAPGVDLEAITGALGPLPGVPSFTPPDQPELPALPELPVSPLPDQPRPEPAPPTPGPLETGVVADARLAAANPPGLAPTEPALEPSRASGTGRTDESDLFAVLDRSSAPARAPPVASPVHSCPGGAASSSGHAESAGLLPLGADDATRRASLLLGARSCASNSVLDPLLRPD